MTRFRGQHDMSTGMYCTSTGTRPIRTFDQAPCCGGFLFFSFFFFPFAAGSPQLHERAGIRNGSQFSRTIRGWCFADCGGKRGPVRDCCLPCPNMRQSGLVVHNAVHSDIPHLDKLEEDNKPYLFTYAIQTTYGTGTSAFPSSLLLCTRAHLS